jgi:DNA transformation protein and related proteins
LPARLFDDTEELSEWARAALAAAQRAALKKMPKARKAAAKTVPKKAKAMTKAAKRVSNKSKPRKKSSS